MPLIIVRNDITKMAVDAIVNAAKESLLGGGGVDGCIHRAAGPELLAECRTLHGCQTGQAKATRGYKLPAKYVIHTVGPIVHGPLTSRDCELLASCYRSCLELAAEHRLESVAFCCISTGEFHFPHALAAEIATQTILHYQQTHQNRLKVIFNVFKDKDYELYKRKLERHCPSKGNDTNC